ncbi:DNA-directed RNA polymerase subunit alpha [Aminobacterium colombiense]|uniref:DNA-directed RNA polymerase subunit alpha n=2 Tax=Aminobacterium TaxID=81466 RepID=D5EE09_AMICL|nr:DNA-directed RNA polymerase, alpha subunit [Aminobacterium colombiense DSM 12261]
MLDKVELMRPEIRIEECSSTFGKVIVEPLERGYGVTLGNALRRVLLSSVKGAAITSVRVDGVLHEFSTIPGVREDVIELMLNLKHIPVHSYSKDVKVLHLEAEGPKQVVAADIQPDSEIEFIDPDAPVCVLEDGAQLSMDLYIEQGVGYATIDRPRPAYLPADALLIDAIYSPVLKVHYDVEAARVGQRTDYERLVLDVTTNGVIAPDVAVGEAAKIIRSYFGFIVEDVDKLHPLEGIDEEEAALSADEAAAEAAEAAKEEDDLLSRPVRELELSIRSENCLLRGGIHTIGDLLTRTRDDLLKIRNLGKISLREIEERLEKQGLRLSTEKSEEKAVKED